MVSKLTDISRISVVVHVSDHFVDGKLVAGLNKQEIDTDRAGGCEMH